METTERSYPHIVSAIFGTPWAILPDKLAVILDLIAFRASGARLTAEEIQARIGAVNRPAAGQSGGIAVLSLFGTVFNHAGMMAEMSGGTSVESFTKGFRAALADPMVGGILIRVDSPGGSVDGVPELANEILASRGSKPIWALADTMAASAAYWIASAADEFAITPSGMVGSIGVLAAHEDVSRMHDTLGVKTTLISAGKYKTEANPYEPLSEDAKAHIQGMVDTYYSMFTSAVARHRGQAVADVRDGFGEGRMVAAKQAVEMGMADRVASYDETIAQMQKRMKRGNVKAEAEPMDLDTRERRLRLAAMR
ncbi:MAG: S49 family peptidase [Sulfuricaulis sp.]|nr:S49 family peptidase [Sulfuricaulis sp.]